MEIQKLRIFITLYETENYTRTAQELNMTQPGVTYSIKSVENELGEKLFIRNRRHVVPTKKGKVFYQQVKPLINRYYQAIQSIKDIDQIESKTINIGCSYTPYNQAKIGEWIKVYHQLHPEIRFSITSLGHNNLKKYLENEDIDCLLTSKGDASDLKNINSTSIAHDRFFAIIPKNNPLSKKKFLDVRDFSNQKLILIDNSWTGVEMIHLQEKIIKSNSNLDITYANDIFSATILMRSLDAITLGLNFIYLNNISDLVHVPLKESRVIYYEIVTSKRNHNQACQNFIHFIKQHEIN